MEAVGEEEEVEAGASQNCCCWEVVEEMKKLNYFERVEEGRMSFVVVMRILVVVLMKVVEMETHLMEVVSFLVKVVVELVEMKTTASDLVENRVEESSHEKVPFKEFPFKINVEMRGKIPDTPLTIKP